MYLIHCDGIKKSRYKASIVKILQITIQTIYLKNNYLGNIRYPREIICYFVRII